MTVSEEEIIGFLKHELGEALIDTLKERERRVFAKIKSAAVRRAIKALKDKYSSLRLMTISAIDHGLDFEFLYHIHIDGNVLTLRIVRPKEDNTLESIADIIPAANFIEREISDLFGIKIVNHPQPQPLILPENWPNDKRPLRKPLEGELPPQARPVAEALISMGCVAPVSAFIQKKREEAGLPRNPPITFTDEKAMKEFHEIVKASNFAEKAGFDWEKKRLRYK